MKRKSRKILYIFSWFGLVLYLVYGLMFASRKADEVICNMVDVNVKDSISNKFVTSDRIKKMMTEAGKLPLGIPLNSINTKELEDTIAHMVAVRDVQVYKTLNGALRIDVKQRTPIVRIFNANNQSYYIDNESRIMPTLPNFSARVLIVSGNIREPFTPKVNLNVMQWNDTLLNKKPPFICQLWELVRFITNDEFWRAQIEQIYVESPNDIYLTPVVGPHTIQFGGIDSYQIKLKKLKTFYTEAIPYEGWNKYKTINLKYSNQIICTKR